MVRWRGAQSRSRVPDLVLLLEREEGGRTMSAYIPTRRQAILISPRQTITVDGGGTTVYRAIQD